MGTVESAELYSSRSGDAPSEVVEARYHTSVTDEGGPADYSISFILTSEYPAWYLTNIELANETEEGEVFFPFLVPDEHAVVAGGLIPYIESRLLVQGGDTAKFDNFLEPVEPPAIPQAS